eukprot:scaffold16119_cov162-Amphora_coffeaeformis.AAC.10
MLKRVLVFASLLSLVDLSEGAHASVRRVKMKASQKRRTFPYIQAVMSTSIGGRNRDGPLDSTYRTKRGKWVSDKKYWNDDRSPNILRMNKPYRWARVRGRARGGERDNGRHFQATRDQSFKSKGMNLKRVRRDFMSATRNIPLTIESPPPMAPSTNGVAVIYEGLLRAPMRRQPVPSTSDTTDLTRDKAPSFAPAIPTTQSPTTRPTSISTRSPTYTPSTSHTTPAILYERPTPSPFSYSPTRYPVASPTSSPTRSPDGNPTSSPSNTSSEQDVTTLTWQEVPTGHLFSKIDGEVFGAALSISENGSVVTVGAFLNDQTNENGGRIARYDITKQSTAEVFGKEDAYLGFEVYTSSDGNRLTAFDSSAGTVYIYQYTTETEDYELLQEFAVDIFPGSADFALSGDGNWLVFVGEDYDGDTGITNIRVILHEFDRNLGKFMPFGEPVLFGTTDASEWGYFDVAIAHTGEYLAVSQLGQGEFVGEIRTYKRTTNQLDEVGIPFLSEDTDDDFGHDIEVQITPTGQLVIGFSVLVEEAVYIYAMQGDSKWALIGTPIRAADVLGAMSDVRFGFDISLSNSGDRILVGAPDFGDGAGAVQAFDYQGGAWSAIGPILIGPGGSQFGELVACNVDCSFIAVGAPEDCLEEGVCGGSVYLYQNSSRTTHNRERYN